MGEEKVPGQGSSLGCSTSSWTQQLCASSHRRAGQRVLETCQPHWVADRLAGTHNTQPLGTAHSVCKVCVSSFLSCLGVPSSYPAHPVPETVEQSGDMHNLKEGKKFLVFLSFSNCWFFFLKSDHVESFDRAAK